MNRRAFLLGAIAAPVVAPVVAKAAAPPSTGGAVMRGASLMVGQAGAETIPLPSWLIDTVSEASGIPKRFLMGEIDPRIPKVRLSAFVDTDDDPENV